MSKTQTKDRIARTHVEIGKLCVNINGSLTLHVPTNNKGIAKVTGGEFMSYRIKNIEFENSNDPDYLL